MKSLLCGVLVVGVFLSGCHVDQPHYYHGGADNGLSPAYVDPEVTYIEVYDSYGDSSHVVSPSYLNPYMDDGWFQLNWSVSTYDDYIVEYRVSDNPSVFGSILIDSEYCGIDMPCGQDGVQFCQYSSDLTLSCDADMRSRVNVDGLIYSLPEVLYLIVQTCSPDYFYCDTATTRIVVE